MKPKAADVAVQVWQSNGVLLERYAYTTGTEEPLPKHNHAEYQFGLSFDCAGEYFYRGTTHVIPCGSLSIIHSGEVHAPSDRTFLPNPAHFGMAHIKPEWLQAAAAELTKSKASEPFFPVPFITNPELNHLYLTLLATTQNASKLEQETALWNFLTYLIAHYASNQTAMQPVKPVHSSIEQTRDYLHHHYADDISLKELAKVAGLSRFHFCRLFSREVGISPGAYQTQQRIEQAKKLLAQGCSIATVVEKTGVYDHSHFGWHFKRQVGTTPSRYTSEIAISS